MGDLNYSIMLGGALSPVSVALTNNGTVALTVNATAKVIYNGVTNTRSCTMVDMMKQVGGMGDDFYFPQSVSLGGYASLQKFELDCIIRKSNLGVYFKASDNYVSGGLVPYFRIGALIVSDAQKTLNLGSLYGALSKYEVKNPPAPVFVCRSSQFPSAGPDFTFSGFKYVNTNINPSDVKLTVTEGGTGSFTSDRRSKFTFSESLFLFDNKKIEVPLSAFVNNVADVVITLSASAPAGDGRSLGNESFKVRLTSTLNSLPIITLNQTSTSAQYLQYGVHRIRVNTLFAKQLVARANTGLDTVLSMATQQLQEPQLGKGFYADFVLPRYSENVHGSSRDFSLSIKHVVDNNAHVIHTGMLADTELSVRLFVPLDATPLNTGYCARVFLTTGKIGDGKWQGAHFYYTDSAQSALAINKNSDLSMFEGVVILDMQTEPMDFNGANALYFWEMFYYVPMMVFKRLLQESRFTEATRWIKYIWSPEGYLLDGQPAAWQWNVRPLEEDVSWNASPLDSVDPDAVAQADPMHYKVATFMSWLDLLIARGDAAYRQLERDTLNEAKMWYVQALSVLGDEPWLNFNVDWGNPSLKEAANWTLKTRTLQALEAVRQQTDTVELFTANSLTDLFLPQQNDKLLGYWQTLAQRLYNLRHHLSIDGQPLSLAIYAAPADPSALLSAAVIASQGGSNLPAAVMPLYRFPIMLENARGMVNQLTQFGSNLLSITERQDAEALSELLLTQGAELMLQSLSLQQKNIAEIDADQLALEESRLGAQSRLTHYSKLYDEDVNRGETHAMELALSAAVLSTTARAAYTIAAGLDAVPNIYGVAFGGSRYGSIAKAVGTGIEIGASASHAAAERIAQSESYRRRRQEWDVQRNTAECEMKQIDAHLAALAIKREAAVMQKTYLETQQSQARAQMTFLQNKFTNKALYNWLRGKLAAIYYQFYDLTISRCLMAQEAWKWTMGTANASFIRPGAWQGTYAGLMAGETLQLSLAQMEERYLQADEREKEVTRTVCLSEVYAGLAGKDAFTLATAVTTLVTAGKGSAGTAANGLTVTSDKRLQASLKLSDLKIGKDYPDALGKTRRIKQISVTLPALTGPYQDVRAVLSYGGSVVLPRGCDALAVSHGMNDSGQFQLDFNDSRWLPFEGIPVEDTGTLVLSFPDIGDRQKALLLSLTDIILHIRYTIIG